MKNGPLNIEYVKSAARRAKQKQVKAAKESGPTTVFAWFKNGTVYFVMASKQVAIQLSGVDKEFVGQTKDREALRIAAILPGQVCRFSRDLKTHRRA